MIERDGVRAFRLHAGPTISRDVGATATPRGQHQIGKTRTDIKDTDLVRLPVLMSRSRRVVATAAVALAASLAIPALASAEPAPKAPDQRTLNSLSAFAPAIIGSVTTPGPDGKINPSLLAQAQALADNPQVPPQAKAIWKQITDFLGEPGRQQLVASRVAEQRKAKPGDPEIPTGPGAPKIQEFLYPTLGFGCMPENGNSLGRALVTAGPQQAPAPGPKRGEAGYVYTSLGTGPAVDSHTHKLWVSWLNIDTGRSGQIQLKRNPLINVQDGPGTFTAIAHTGKGRVVSTAYGEVTTKTKGKVISCTIAPTIGIAII